jgi:hypothetical protein
MVEYVVLITLLVALVGGALLLLAQAIWDKLVSVNVDLGS